MKVLTLLEEWALCPRVPLSSVASCDPCHHLIGTPPPIFAGFSSLLGSCPQGGHCGREVQKAHPLPSSLQVVASNPYLGDGRGAASLRLLKVMHQNIHPSLGQRWETTMPVLLEYLDGEAREAGSPIATPDPACTQCATRVGRNKPSCNLRKGLDGS